MLSFYPFTAPEVPKNSKRTPMCTRSPKEPQKDSKVTTKLVTRARDSEWNDVGPALQFFWDSSGKSLKAQCLLDGCEVYAADKGFVFNVVPAGRGRTISLKASHDLDRKGWMCDINTCLSEHATSLEDLEVVEKAKRRASISKAKESVLQVDDVEPDKCTICWKRLPCVCSVADGVDAERALNIA